MSNPKDRPVPEKVPFWLDPKKRSIMFQIAVLAMVGLLAYYLVSNTIINLQKQNIATGFGFLNKESAFEVGESMIPYSAASSYGRALIVGALNTLKVAFIGIIFTIFLGTIIGVARLSSNWLVSKLAAIYIEVMQDIPILLQLFFWYAIFYETLPSPRQALSPMNGVFLCNRGVAFAIPEAPPGPQLHASGLLCSLWAGLFPSSMGKKAAGKNGAIFPYLPGLNRLDLGAAFGHLVSGRCTDEDECPQAYRV